MHAISRARTCDSNSELASLRDVVKEGREARHVDVCTGREVIDRQTDRQTAKQKDRQSDRRTDKKIERETRESTHRPQRERELTLIYKRSSGGSSNKTKSGRAGGGAGEG